MKKQVFSVFAAALLMIPFMGAKADTVDEGQSTSGTEFYVTFLQGDSDDSGKTDAGALKRFILSLTITASEDANVKIENPYYNWDTTATVAANSKTEIAIFDGVKTDTRILTGTAGSPSAHANGNARYCYTFNPERVDSSALHVTSDKPISLYASNYKAATFDATNVLPVKSLQDQYKIVCYTPSDHKDAAGTASQGSHFAIVAVEDNTIVEYTLTANTYNNKHKKDSVVKTNVLKKGQVWYVWTGKGQLMGFGHQADLSGTMVKAYDATTGAAKKIAVFQGNPHTNIPFYKDLPSPQPEKPIGERDHIFSQAMPIATWGNTFILTTSELRDRDVIRVMAEDDGTEVYLNGDKTKPIHVFDFSKDTKHYWEFEIGVEGVTNGRVAADGNFFAGESFLLQTSCPCAVHEFMVSKKYGKENKSNGDPAMLWINPIEQRIDQITFATYSSKNGTTHHYANVVTTADNADKMTLNDNPIGSEFKFVNNDATIGYKYAKLSLGTTAGSHTLKGDADKGFIAHVYGCTGNESYGYNAGGSTKPLDASIEINGIEFKPGDKNVVCGDDKVDFGCKLNFQHDSIYWFFGDGKDTVSKPDAEIVTHFYDKAEVYQAYVIIYRHIDGDATCKTWNRTTRLDFTVNIGNFKVDIKGQKMPECTKQGDEVDFTIYLDNPAMVSLTSDSAKFTFNKAALDDGFTTSAISVVGDTMLIVHLPSTAANEKEYGLHLHIGSQCPNSVLDKDMTFKLHFDVTRLCQRYSNVLGIISDSITSKGQTLSDFVWYRDGKVMPNEKTSVLVLDENEPKTGEFKVCYVIHEKGQVDYDYCTCPVTFKEDKSQPVFNDQPDSAGIVATYAVGGDKVFVNADYKGKTDIECYAEWVKVDGKVYKGLKFDIPDGGCTIPAPEENGFYILRVVTDGSRRSFKMIINH